MRIATLALFVGGLACAKNSANEQVGAARDSTANGRSDSARGQPVTSKGDTINPGVDSSMTKGPDTATTTEADSVRAW
jgi:hypothetical protein